MTPTDTPPEAETSEQFERELADLIARAFARGTAVERTWNVSVPVADAPNWKIEISKTYSDDDPPYVPEFLDE